MNLLTDNIKEFQDKLGFENKIEYEDEKVNTYYNNWRFLYEYQKELSEIADISVDSILYSEYYWSARFVQEYHNRYGKDAGFDQRHFKLIEKIEHTLGSVDVLLLEKLEYDRISEP